MSVAQDVSVRAQLSASTITRDESVTLTITATGIDAELDASSLDRDFDVVGRSSSRQVSTVIDSSNRMVNTSEVTWALELLPKGVGVFTVPAVKVGDYETQLLTLTVNEVPSGAKRDVFVEASVDTTNPWVQSQVVMTLRVFQAIEIVDGGLDVPAAEDLVVERLGEDTRSREVRDGREYSVTERRFALFPQRSGSITIEPVMLSVTVPAEPNRVRGFFSPTRKLTRRTDPVTLNVQARPPSGVAWWLPARNLVLQSQWQGDPNAAQVDQPLTRTMVIRAEGVLESQLPAISIPAVDGLSLYAEEPKVGKAADATGLVSEQRINWALIPQRSGTLTLPAVTVEWFNTLTGRSETAELPAETITVLAGSSASGNDTAVTASNNADAQWSSSDSDELASLSDSALDGDRGTEPLSDSSNDPVSLNNTGDAGDNSGVTRQIANLQSTADRWRLLTFAITGLWLLTAAAWWMLRRTTDAGQSRPPLADRMSPLTGHVDALYQRLAPLNAVERACQEDDLSALKVALLAWAARQWSDDAPTTLDGIQSRLPAGAARDKLADLQAALYSRTQTINGVSGLELADLPNELKLALQQTDDGGASRSLNTTAANDGSVSAKGVSRLPKL